MTIINYLRSPAATLIVLCSALLAQLPHAADVFRLIVVGDGLWPVLHSYTYAIALELAVLLFVVQRRNIESYAFAGVSILVNLSYYHLHGVQLLSVAAAPAWLVSIALPAAIAQYSHLIAAATDAPATDADASPDDAHTDALDAVQVQPAPPVRSELHHATLPPAQVDAPATPTAPDATDDATPQPDKRTRAQQMRSEGYNTAEIARMTGVHRSTITRWLGADVVQTNGGTQL